MPKKSTIAEQEELIQVLKFTPRTYKIRLWGYGGEYVMGEVDRKIYDYFRHRRLDLSDFAWDDAYSEEQNIPEDMQPFYPGQWHDCDNMGHCWGVDRNAGTVQVDDENSDTVYEQSLDSISGYGMDGEPPEPEWTSGDEIWIDMRPAGTPVFMGVSSEKGTFFEGEIQLKMPFNPGKLSFTTDDFDGNEIITGVQYDGEDIENWGGDTNGKGSDFGFYVAGSNQGNGYERYRNMDDIVYPMTDWFPKKIQPVREGLYMIRTPGRNSYTHQAKWTGTRWISSWQEDSNSTEELKIKEWQGLSVDPDAESTAPSLAHFSPDVLKTALDQLAEEHGTPTADEIEALEQVECVQCEWSGLVDETLDSDSEMTCPKCGQAVEFVNGEDNMDIEDALEELKLEFETLMAQEEEQQHLEQQFDEIIAKKKTSKKSKE